MEYSIREPFLNNIYNEIDEPRKKYGELKKCELHIHTPESACYRFYTPDKADKDNLEGNYLYSRLSLDEVLRYSLQVGYLSNVKYEDINKNIKYYNSSEYIEKLKEKRIPYGSLKEYIAYMTIAYKLYKEKIEIGIVSDHNTISGYEKLTYAVNKYFNDNYKDKRKLVRLFLGVEVSCSDRNHLMIIYDENKRERLQAYLDEIILEKGLGSYYDTRKIIEDMKEHNAITYICHINSSKLLGNGAYKKKLFNSKGLNGIGLSNLEVIDREKNRIKQFRCDISDIAILHEGDSHAINEIGVKNTWIKMSNLHFKSLRKSFLNHQVCIYSTKQKPVGKYIKGLVVESGENGFLGKNKKNDEKGLFAVDFSKDLNCIIGGRGSGKSTILNILEVVYSMECDNWELLNYIAQHKKIYSIFMNESDEYLIEFIPQTSIRGSYTNLPTILRQSYIEEDNIYKLKEQWYNVFKIIYVKGKRKYVEVKSSDIKTLFKQVFRRAYNINKLVDKINNKQISDYINTVITYNIEYDEINKYIRELTSAPSTRALKVIRDNIDNILKMIENRRMAFEDVIKEFNEVNEKILIISYEPMYEVKEYFDKFIEIFEKDKYDNPPDIVTSQYINNTLLTWGNVQDYFSELIRTKNYFEILYLILNKKYSELNRILPIENFQTREESYNTIERGLEKLNGTNRNKVYTQIFNKIKINEHILRQSIISCFKVLDNFNLKFNVNNKEDVQNKSDNFKELKSLSLGQKVVALLTFVFNFGKIVGDSTPLIIDQPEDNLDNVYIYRTLVNSLKSIKNNRQVVIVTHSSTIVTNADAEEVIVMDSDGRKGWVEKMGYPSDETITNHIINYLEGGRESFNHKVKMYNVITEK